MKPSRYPYYHRCVRRFFTMVVPPGQDVLLVGYDGDWDLTELRPRRGVFLCTDEHAELPVRRGGFESQRGFDLRPIQGKFDYIILKNALGSCPDIGTFLCDLPRLCKPETRVIVYSYNYLWKLGLRLAEAVRLKRRGGLQNWLSIRDLNNMLTTAGFQRVGVARWQIFPFFLGGLGVPLNWLGKFLFFLDWLKLNQFQVFRPLPAGPGAPGEAEDESLTICLTCRDERDNVESLVRAIPQLTPNQEILFVEGHSRDGTRAEIERVIEAYPEKNIRVIGQPGKGQGDAIREGFAQARGNIIILLESDMTSPPENVRFVYESLRRRHAEFIEGSRFVYPLSLRAMPLANQLGNGSFAYFFSWLFGGHLTDVLSGIKAIRKSDFQKVLCRWNDWGINDPFGDFELLFGAVRLGLLCAEQPIHYRPRPYGKTKTRVWYHGYILAKMALNAFLRFRG
jgi:hypothetical protein